MAEYYIELIEGCSPHVREIPLGIYEARSPDAAVTDAVRQWSLSSLPAESFVATPVEKGGADDV